jgi:BON domain
MSPKLAGLSCVCLIAGLAACATRPPPTPEDQSLTASVEAALENDQRIYARHVDVSVDDGVVHLRGFVWSPNELFYAKNDAASVPGVRGVSNELELPRGGVSGSSR